MFNNITVEADSGQTFHFNEAEADWAGRYQAGRECADLYWLPDGTWVLRRCGTTAQGTGARARVIGAEEARAWLDARPCARLRAACLCAHRTLDLLASLRHGLSAPAEQEVRGLWRVMREMVDAGMALVPPREPTSLADLSAARAAVDEAISWCQELEARLATSATPSATEERPATPGKTVEHCQGSEGAPADDDYESVGKLQPYWSLHFGSYQALRNAMGDKVRTLPGTAKNPDAKNRLRLHRSDLIAFLCTVPPLPGKSPAAQTTKAAENMRASEADAAKGKALIGAERQREQTKAQIREENLRKKRGC
jgi:hypothetical protein